MARILVVAASYPPRIGGYERQVEETQRLLRGLGHDVKVLACVPRGPRGPLAESPSPTPSHVLGVPSRFLVGDSFPVPEAGAIRRAVRSGGWDLVITNTRFFLPTYQAARAAHAARIPYIHVEHGSGPLRGRHAAVDAVAATFDGTAGRWTVRHAAATVGVSRAASSFLRRLGAADPVTIGNVVPFDAEADVERRLADLAGTLAERPIVSVARLVPNKGLLDLVAAAGQLPPDVRPRLRLVGDGPQRDALAQRARQDGVALELAGMVPPGQVRSEFLAAGLACQPSLEEGFGLAVLEAAACGTPVVASDCAAHRELLQDGRLGLLHRAGDAADLARALREARANPGATVERARVAYLELRARSSPEQAAAAWRSLLDRFGLSAAALPSKPK